MAAKTKKAAIKKPVLKEKPLNKSKAVKKTAKKAKKESDETELKLPETPAVKKVEKKRKNYIFWLALILAIAGGAYLARGIFIAALVNGSPLTRYEVIKELEKNYGQQTLDNLVTKKLILQEQKKKNITISDDEVNKEIEDIKKSVESQGANLDQLLAQQGQTMDMLKENVKIQKGIEKIFESETAVTDDEIKTYYETNKASFEDKTLEDVKEDIKKQLVSQKLSSKYSEWISKVKTDAKIQYFVSY